MEDIRAFCDGVYATVQRYNDNGAIPPAGHVWGVYTYQCDDNCGAYSCAAAFDDASSRDPLVDPTPQPTAS